MLRRVLRLQLQETTMDKIITSFGEEALARRKAMLKTAFGPVIAEALADPQVVEVMVNPDGRLWLDRLDSQVVQIHRHCAAMVGSRTHHSAWWQAISDLEVHERSPIVSAELPRNGRTL